MTGITIALMFGAFIASAYGLDSSYLTYAAVLVVAMEIVFLSNANLNFIL